MFAVQQNVVVQNIRPGNNILKEKGRRDQEDEDEAHSTGETRIRLPAVLFYAFPPLQPNWPLLLIFPAVGGLPRELKKHQNPRSEELKGQRKKKTKKVKDLSEEVQEARGRRNRRSEQQV